MMHGRLMDSGYALLGSLGWLCIPKCPLCLTAGVYAATGIAIPFLHGQWLRLGLLVAMAGLFAVGVWRLRQKRSRTCCG